MRNNPPNADSDPRRISDTTLELATDPWDDSENDRGVLLLVGNEVPTLEPLQSAFRDNRCQVSIALSADEALAQLASGPVDVIVSDADMASDDCASFLAQVRERWPDVVCILLTARDAPDPPLPGESRRVAHRTLDRDCGANAVRCIVLDALAMRRMWLANRRLAAIAVSQSGLLRELDSEIEASAARHLQALSDAKSEIETAHGSLKQGFLDTVQVLAGLTEMREGRRRGHSRRIAELAYRLARDLDVDEAGAQNVMLAALLRDLGKIGLPDAVVRKPELELNDAERELMRKHPVIGELVLMQVAPLQDVVPLIRHHHERYDGQGYPDGLKGSAIPLGARILSVVNDFESLQTGEHSKHNYAVSEAREFLQKNVGGRYDPDVVRTFLRRWDGERAPTRTGDTGAFVRPDTAPTQQRMHNATDELQRDGDVMALRPDGLRPGMVLARDLFHIDGYLLLARGFELDSHVIGRLARLERGLGRPITVLLEPASIARQP